MAEERTTKRPASRTEAGSIIAELWAEREQRPPATAPPLSPPPFGIYPPEPHGRRTLVAPLIIVLVSVAVLGVVARATGFIGASSKASFVVEADALCAQTNGAVNAISRPTGYPALAAAASTFVSTTDAQLGRLGALELPGGADRGPARAVVRAMTATKDAGRTMQGAAAAGDAAMTAAASRSLAAASHDAVARARAYGFTACASGVETGVGALVAGANGAVKESFVSAGAKLCADAERKLDALRAPRNPVEGTAYFQQFFTLIDGLAGGLRALPVPPGDEAIVVELIGAVEKFSSLAKQYVSAAQSGDRKRMTAIEREFDAAGPTVDQKFADYGLTGCMA